MKYLSLITMLVLGLMVAVQGQKSDSNRIEKRWMGEIFKKVKETVEKPLKKTAEELAKKAKEEAYKKTFDASKGTVEGVFNKAGSKVNFGDLVKTMTKLVKGEASVKDCQTMCQGSFSILELVMGPKGSILSKASSMVCNPLCNTVVAKMKLSG